MCDSLGSGQRRERQKRRLPQKSAWDSGLDLEELRERARSAVAYRFPSCAGLRVPGTCPLEVGVGIITLEQDLGHGGRRSMCSAAELNVRLDGCICRGRGKRKSCIQLTCFPGWSGHQIVLSSTFKW